MTFNGSPSITRDREIRFEALSIVDGLRLINKEEFDRLEY